MEHKTNWSWKCWWLFTTGWFILTAGVLFLSEKFNDIDAILYPSVFILILSMLIGPGTIGILLPLPFTQEALLVRRVAPFISYCVCFFLMRMFYLLCLTLGLF